MAKNRDKGPNDSAPATEAPATGAPVVEETPVVATEAAPVVSAPADAPATGEIVPVGEATEGEVAFANLSKILPKTYSGLLRRLKQVSQEELEVAGEALPALAKTNLYAMLDRMNPQKPGVFIKSYGFRVPGAMVYHGTGNNEAKPELLPPGGIFSSEGRMLSVPQSHSAMLKVPATMRFYVLMVVDGYSWWPPRDKSIPLPPDVNPDSKAPICRSLDQKVGFRYGSCDACPNLPWKNGKMPEKDSCGTETTVYFVLADFSGIYSMTFAKTAIKEGALPIKKKANQWAKPWDFQFQIVTHPETGKTDPTQKWYVPASSVYTDGEHPAGVAPTEAEAALCALLCEKLQADVYLPQLASIYSRAAGGHHQIPAGGAPEQQADMSGLAAGVAIPGGVAPAQAAVVDYSKNNV